MALITEWYEDDANALRVFLNSPTGIRFVAALETMTPQLDKDPESHEKDSLKAREQRGWSRCIKAHLLLSAQQQPESPEIKFVNITTPKPADDPLHPDHRR